MPQMLLTHELLRHTAGCGEIHARDLELVLLLASGCVEHGGWVELRRWQRDLDMAEGSLDQ